jgi:ATP-binding cassette subfamily B protein
MDFSAKMSGPHPGLAIKDPPMPPTLPPAPGSRQSEWRTIGTLLPYLWPADRSDLRTRVLGAMLLLLGAKAANVTVPFFFKAAVDALDRQSALLAVPIMAVLAYGLARVMAQGFGEIRDSIFVKVSQHAQRLVALETFRHLHALSLRFHLDRQTGGITRAIERGTKGVEFLLRFMSFNIIPTVIEIGLVCVILYLQFGWPMATVTFLTMTVYIGFTLAVSEWRTQFRREMNQTDSDANTKAIDSLLNFETVKYFGNEAHEARRFDESLGRYERAAVKSQVTLSTLNVGQGLIIAAGLVGVMTLAARGVAGGTMTVGDFVMVNTFLIQLYVPLNFLGFAYREIKQALIDLERMFDLLREPAEIKDKPDAKPLAVGAGEIRFENVSFAYDERRRILHGVDFRVPPGKTVAIVGASGAGKSTISRLLFRFYDVSDGRILIDGQDIRDVTQTSLRAAIGIVPQDTVLFNDTVRYNIRYGRPGADDAEVEEAAKLARIHDFVERLPDGYRSMVGERGLKLSGGEKQRVAIARTILKHPAILVFDEATSALDTHTEKEIQDALGSISRNRTTLTIAHRLSTVIHADEILVFDHGKIVERGCHDDLLFRDGAYAAMWRRQQEAEKTRERLHEMEAEAAT